MKNLTPALELAKTNKASFPNESEAYRRARNDLLVEEIELRRHVERVNEQRRKLPPGGEVKKKYSFISPKGPLTLADLFGDKQTLIIYSAMFGPKRDKPCPMCSSMMKTYDHKLENIKERVAMVFTARSPIERIEKEKPKHGWDHLDFVSDTDGDFTRDYVSKDDADIPGYTVFTKKDGVIRHFWSGEMSGEMADPGQDPRGAQELDPLWTILDTTPEGRGTDWYPKL